MTPPHGRSSKLPFEAPAFSAAAERIASDIFDAILPRPDIGLAKLRCIEIACLDAKLEIVGMRTFDRPGALVAVVAGLLLAALHAWPPR
jgi:hypothetical protein